MNFNISSWSIRRPVPTIVLFLVLTVAGLVAFGQLGIDLNPNIDIPAVVVEVNQVGAGPEELETQVTKKVEDAVAGLGNIDQIQSTVSDGSSSTVIEFDLGVDTEQATNDVRDAITRIRQDLPQDAEDPIVRRLRFEGGPIMTYTVSSTERSVEALSDLVDRTISRELLATRGVAQVNRVGGVDREIRVDLDPRQLNALGITATEINDQIRRFNIDLPGGRTDVSGIEQGIRTLGSAETVEALRNFRVVLPSGDTVPLSSLGTVEDDFSEVRQSAYLNNEAVVAFQIFRSSGSVVITVEEGVRDAIATLEETLPDDIRFQLIFTVADDIRDAYQASIDALILGCILAVVVVGLFLRDWRTTVITATALPLSIIPTFLVLQALGYTLNSMSLLALTLAVGNLVDDAIVEIENAERHIQMGKPPFQAALDSTAEVGLAVVTTTATIVAVFVPVAFMGGVPGQFFKPFGVTVSVATMFSTLVARLVTPMMSAYLLKPRPVRNGNGHRMGAVQTADGLIVPRRLIPYHRLLNSALRHRLLTVGLAIAFFISSLMLARFIPTSLFESGNTDLSTISVELPPGSTLAKTEQVTANVTDRLLASPAVDSVFVSQTPGEANAVVELLPKDERDLTREAFERQLRDQLQQIPGTRITFVNQGAGGSSKALDIVLKSDNPDALEQAAQALTRQMRQIPGLVEVSSTASLVQPEILIQPDPARAADLGVSVSDIARTASLATIGDTESNLAEFDVGDRQIPIRVRLAQRFRDDISTLENLQVPSQNGSQVPLIAVADIRYGSGPAEINRIDRSRQVTVGANLQGITLGQAIEAVDPFLETLPAGVTQQPTGDAEIQQEIFSRFGLALGTAILIIYAVLVLLYNDFIFPFAVMVALPLCIGGALLGLMIAQKPLGLFALIGIVLLMGLVTKNSILLVDYALMARQAGKTPRQSVIEAGMTRLRPILMTSISTVAGMVPIALEWGAGGETRSPMAIAVIGGFSTATLLTLVVVPVVFTYISGFRDRLAKLLGRVTDVGKAPPDVSEEKTRQQGSTQPREPLNK
ncbi:efflux RND transporter permease subunit [Romeria aff. gracilis LEGE 07310]|uniref:Efflux RND transporter permease subunit n=1 Tax=Vasconcelosia minhoensis LEGE 07310 TaxID=915328 RepID=A0A8J7DE97_9CYAN|nr:efflux RND transporter permease subunit [Romeria gracilis]MBE9079628.1 efflux RND transporter permease subunit [Romeria aff. gracilis LEGE 07310]